MAHNYKCRHAALGSQEGIRCNMSAGEVKCSPPGLDTALYKNLPFKEGERPSHPAWVNLVQ